MPTISLAPASTAAFDAKPPLQWCGGKYTAPVIDLVHQEYMVHRALSPDCYYVSPFAGACGDIHRVSPDRVFANDMNMALIRFYNWVSWGDLDNVVWSPENSEEIYYAVRRRFNVLAAIARKYINSEAIVLGDIVELASFEMSEPAAKHIKLMATLAEEAYLETCSYMDSLFVELMPFVDDQMSADFLWLNQMGFNGLYRENSKRAFNAPIGRNSRKEVYQPRSTHGMESYRCRYQSWDFSMGDYRRVAQSFASITQSRFAGHFVYCDPLYSETSAEMYAWSEPFDYEALADQLVAWHALGNTVCMTNHDTPVNRSMLEERGFEIVSTSFRQTVAANGSDRRQRTPEIFAILRAA